MDARKLFSFTPELTAELLEFLKECKAKKDFANVDFNSDKILVTWGCFYFDVLARLYACLRIIRQLQFQSKPE